MNETIQVLGAINRKCELCGKVELVRHIKKGDDLFLLCTNCFKWKFNIEGYKDRIMKRAGELCVNR